MRASLLAAARRGGQIDLACLIAPLAGVVAAAGFRPLALWPAVLFGVALLAGLIARAPTAGRAALLGWLWGFGHFCLGNNWIATAFTYQAKMPAWLGGIAVGLLALYLAVYPALAATVAWFARRRPVALIAALAGAWIVSEWLRGWVFTGFAWNPLAATALGGFTRAGLAQVLPWTGTYALSGGVVLLAGLWWLGFEARIAHPVRALGLVALPLAAGIIPQLSPREEPGHLPFTLVQPGIAQEQIDDPRYFNQQFATIARLSLPRHPGQRRLVLWPESGTPDYLHDGYPDWFYLDSTFGGSPVLARSRIARVLGDGAALLTGAVDLDLRAGKVVAARNVVTALDDRGVIRGSYAKAHLVPYGEYLPMRGLLEPLGLSRLVPGALDFAPGPGPRTLDLGQWGRAGVQVCYEIIFPGAVIDRAHRPDYLFNPSNDGWFGDWGPPQHLAQARLRAIEEGLPVLRSTTNGVSAVIDANGLVQQSLPRPVAGRIEGVVPRAHLATPFARLGNVLSLAWAALLLAWPTLLLQRAALAMRRRDGYQDDT